MKVAIQRCTICQAVRLATQDALLDTFYYSQPVICFQYKQTGSGLISAVQLKIPATVVPCSFDEKHDWQLQATTDVAATSGTIRVNATAITVTAAPTPVPDPADPDDALLAILYPVGIRREQGKAIISVMRLIKNGA